MVLFPIHIGLIHQQLHLLNDIYKEAYIETKAQEYINEGQTKNREDIKPKTEDMPAIKMEQSEELEEVKTIVRDIMENKITIKKCLIRRLKKSLNEDLESWRNCPFSQCFTLRKKVVKPHG